MTDTLDPRPYALLEARLGHQFADARRLESALTHKSYLNEHVGEGRVDNERLEFLGDAVVDLVIGHLLMDAQPTRTEGELSKLRASIVNEQGLAEVALGLGLGEWLFLGRGEEHSGGRSKPSLLADAVEAVIAAVYLDAGFEAAFEVIQRLFGGRVAAVGARAEAGAGDFKTRLQERVARSRAQVRYVVVAESGPDHDKLFEVALLLCSRQGEEECARGRGRSKKEAEQQAARACLEELDRRASLSTEPPPASVSGGAATEVAADGVEAAPTATDVTAVGRSAVSEAGAAPVPAESLPPSAPKPPSAG